MLLYDLSGPLNFGNLDWRSEQKRVQPNERVSGRPIGKSKPERGVWYRAAVLGVTEATQCNRQVLACKAFRPGPDAFTLAAGAAAIYSSCLRGPWSFAVVAACLVEVTRLGVQPSEQMRQIQEVTCDQAAQFTF